MRSHDEYDQSDERTSQRYQVAPRHYSTRELGTEHRDRSTRDDENRRDRERPTILRDRLSRVYPPTIPAQRADNDHARGDYRSHRNRADPRQGKKRDTEVTDVRRKGHSRVDDP